MLALELVNSARKTGLMVSTAESCTGGGLGFEITRVPGSSAIFLGGVIAYSNAVKTHLLGVREQTLERFGAVSEETCREMVDGLARLIPTDMQLAISGIAGPGADGPKPEGLVTFAIGLRDQVTSWSHEFGALGRDQVRLSASKMIFERATQAIQRF